MYLRMPIQQADFWNDEMSDMDRDKTSQAWKIRYDGDSFERGVGLKRSIF